MACREEMEENFERAAAIAVFHGHVRRAVISLKDGANLASQQGNTAKSKTLNIVTTLILDSLLGTTLSMISLGMAGYSPNSAHLWKTTCASMKKDVCMFIIMILFYYKMYFNR